uniref:Uncharacterized protein n=1 Tax=Oryza punctata TaxID=4537 RepID=A0A0E0JVE7_ORYPU
MRRSDDRIVSVDRTTRRAILYDPAEHTGRPRLALHEYKFWTESFAVGDDLYVMETIPLPDKLDLGREARPGRSFEALIHRDPRPLDGGRLEHECYWRPLPPPPYVHAGGTRTDGQICGYAVVGESHILMSTHSYGAYSFDTASAAWSKVGDWALPFCGRTEFVPEHGLWLGLSAADDGVLGAWDLSSTIHQQQPPPVAHHGRKGFAVPEVPYDSHVVHLGAGKLCVAKLFMVAHRETCSHSCCDFDSDKMYFAILTGVEVVRCNSDKLDIIKHKSCRYSFGEHYIPIYQYMVATVSNGAYSFDTASAAWSKAGDWSLPFRGRAEHILWFGLSAADDEVLGAWDLSSSTVAQPQPANRGCGGFAVPEPEAPYVRLRRIDTSRLFYPKDELPRASPAAVEEARLPPAIMGFSASMDFMRTSDDKIVTVDDTGRRAILYDPAAHTVRSFAPMTSPKFLNISLAVVGELYIMKKTPHPDKDGARRRRRGTAAGAFVRGARQP